MKTPDQSVIDANYRAKLAARATGATPVLVQQPEPGKGNAPDDVDARYRAKLAARAAGSAAKAAEPKASESKPEAAPEPKPEPAKAAEDHSGRDKRR